MYESDGTDGDAGAPLPRPRAHVWGTPADRALLQAVVEDITRRSGFAVCAMEVLRSDLMLEFVAIAGSPAGSERLMGQGSPLQSMQAVIEAGAEYGGWLFVDSEQLQDEVREVLDEYGHRPDLGERDAEGAWQSTDMFFHLLRGVRGDLRGVLYLDEPRTGLRPTRADVDALNDEIGLAVQSIVNTIEREMFGEQVRMVEAARDVIRTARSRVGVEELTQLVATELPAAFRADLVAVTLADERPEGWDAESVAVIVEATRRVWRSGGQLIVEPDHVWGDDEFAEAHGAAFRARLGEHGIVSSVMIPIGMGEELLGVLSMARGEGRQRWTDSEILGAHAVAMDIAGALVDARAVAQQARLNEELRALDDYRLTMISTIAHELRNPLGVLVGHLDLIGMTGVPPLVQRSLEAMERASDRIESMATNLVALGKVTGAAQLVAVEVPLSSLVVEVLDFVQVLADGAGVRLAGTVEPDLVVQGDSAELQRLVSNLVTNALKYTPAGGSVDVHLEALPDGQVELRVADTGMGIAPEDCEQLFKPFYRAADHRARAKPGMGLGLAIAQRVVDRHEGRIAVTSEPGAGTTFTVRLPRG